jgi:hypothetical protein
MTAAARPRPTSGSSPQPSPQEAKGGPPLGRSALVVVRARAQLLAARPAAAALHVTNGDITVDLLRRAGLAEHALAWADVLHEGPVPVGLDEAGLRRVRAEFIAGADGVDAVAPVRGPRPHPGLLDVATPLTAEALDLGAAAWAALRATDPGGLGEIASSRSPELRFLGEAFDRLSREYPSTRDGLSLTERRILAAVADGAGTAGEVHARVAAREARPYLADLFCFRIVARLVGARTPLLAAEPTGEVTAGTRLRLTAGGRRVLGGKADHLAQGGVDRWIGGVHLDGADSPWRWDEGTEGIVSV